MNPSPKAFDSLGLEKFHVGQKITTSNLFSSPRSFIIEGISREKITFCDEPKNSDFFSIGWEFAIWLTPLNEENQYPIRVFAGTIKKYFTPIPEET